MRTLLLFLIALLPLSSFAQIEKVSKFMEIGVSPLSYKGDISQGYKNWTGAFQLGLKRNGKKRMNGHFNFLAGSLLGQNPEFSYPNSSPNQFFKTSFLSLNYDLQYNIIKKDHFILYISQGIGLMRFTVKDEDNTNLADKFNTRAKNETYNNISFFFPHSIGVMYFLKNDYGVGVQMGRFTPGTDYLDNVSKLSTYKGADNVFAFRFSFIVPISYKKENPAAPVEQTSPVDQTTTPAE